MASSYYSPLKGFAIYAMVIAVSAVVVSSFSWQPNTSRSLLSLSLSSVSTVQQDAAEERRRQSLKQGHHPLISLNLNLDAMAQSGAASRAQELLQRIHALYQEGYYEVSPDTVSFNTVLKAWKEDDNPEKAYEFLQEMLQYGSDDTIQANTISFNTVILAFARRGDHRFCGELLRYMQNSQHLKPDTITYNSVLYSFSQSRDQGSALQAENLLKKMMAPLSNVTADTTSFNTVIHAWAQVADPSAASAAHRAQDLLDHMVLLAAAGNENVKADLFSYSTCISAWARCGENYSERAKEVFDGMLRQKVKPNRFTYTALMSALSKSGKAEKAQAILDDMMFQYSKGNEDMKPDTIAFSCVMDGWAKMSSVDKPQAADQAMKLLSRMKELEFEGMGPNAQTLTSVLTALSRSGTWDACEVARTLVGDMEREYKDGNDHLQPSNIHYNACLNAYARSPRADKGLKALGVLQEMQEHSNPQCHPDIISYNSVIMACANAFGNPELKLRSFNIALDVFKMAMVNDGGIRPTSTTFVHFCKSARRLLPPDQTKLTLRRTFRLCCDRGLVNQVVLEQVRRACQTEDEWKEMTGTASQFIGFGDKLQFTRLPSSYIRYARR
jgi:pentatricopeptide repeat protein